MTSSRIWKSVAAVAALGFALGTPDADAEPTFVHGECIKCHKGREASDGETSVSVWQKSWHGKSADDLIPAKLSASPKRQATMNLLLAANPGKKTFLTDARCIGCHLTKVGASQLGIICESCHGRGSDYKDPHQQPGGYEQSIAKFGMKDLRNFKPRAEICFGCHLAAGSVKIRGISVAVINEVIAQGHPPMDNFDFAAETVKASIFHWPKQKARAGGEAAADLDAAGKAVLKGIPPLTGARPVVPTPTPASAPPTMTPRPAPPTVAGETGEIAVAATPTPRPRRTSIPTPQGGGAISMPSEPPAPQIEATQPPVPPTMPPAAAPPTQTPAPPTSTPVPTATPFPAPESIERLTPSEAALLLQSYAILVLNRALLERAPESNPESPEVRIGPMLRGSTRAERLLELQREALMIQLLALGLPLPTPTPIQVKP